MKKASSWIIYLILLGLLTVVAQQYALQGTWTLTNHKDIKLDPSIDVEFEFAEQIGDNSTIKKKLIVRACYELAYEYQIEENNIYIDYDNVISIPRKCFPGEITTIKSKIDTVFYFMINGTTLTLFDPTGFAPYVFERVDSNSNPAINGGWKILTIEQNPLSENIYINGSHAILCEGKGLAIYKISSRSQIIFNIIKSKGCSNQSRNVLIALDNTAYYRIRNSTFLYLYDYSLNNIFYGFYERFISFKQSLEQINNVLEKKKIQSENKRGDSITMKKENNVAEPIVKNEAKSTSLVASVPANTPSVPAIVPSVPAVAPSAPAKTASVPAIAPSVPVNTPSVPAIAPSVPVNIPSVSAIAPSVPVNTPSVPAIAPSAPAKTASVPHSVSSLSDLTPISIANSFDGKWFINQLSSKPTSSYSNYYLIVNSVAKRFILYGGCNVQFYIYSLTNNKISFGKPTATAKVCTPNIDSNITTPLFSNSAYVEANSKRLKFYDENFKHTITLANSPS